MTSNFFINSKFLTDTPICGFLAPVEFSRLNFFALELSRINLKYRIEFNIFSFQKMTLFLKCNHLSHSYNMNIMTIIYLKKYEHIFCSNDICQVFKNIRNLELQS